MNKTVISITQIAAAVAVAAVTSACEATKSRTPTSPNVAGPIAGVAITTPLPVSPVNGTEVLNTEPLRLVFNNASSNGERKFWYVIELAADAGFNQRLYTHPRVEPAGGAQTTVIPDVRLGADTTYYWRVKADDGANASDFSSAHFDLVVPVVIEPPTPQSPAHGQTLSSNTATLVMANGKVEGRAGSVIYRVQVARDQGFGDIVSVAEVPRSSGAQTSHTTPSLPMSTLLYWRVFATNGILTSPASQVQSFKTPTPAPPPPPPGGGGGGGSGGGGTPVDWTVAQWKAFMDDLIARKGGPTVTYDALSRMKADINALGADWQNGWRGDYRPRLHTPVKGCPPPTAGPNVPNCTWDQVIDLGDWGGRWQWVPRY